MVEYTGIPTDLLDEMIERLREHDELLDRLTRSWTMKFKFADGPEDLLTLGGFSTPTAGDRGPPVSARKRKIRVGNRRGEASYVEVLEQLVSDPEFSFDDAASIVLPRIVTRSARPRASLRAAIDRNRRFERIEGQGELRYRRTGRGHSERR